MSVTRFEPFRDPFREFDRLLSMAASGTRAPLGMPMDVNVIVTGLAEAGYVVEQKDERRNRYQVQARLPLPECATREPAIGEVLALHAGAGARVQLTGTRPG